jgi:hypothetical protein
MQLVEALRYKSEGNGFDSRWAIGISYWLNSRSRNMAIAWVDSVSDTIEYQGYLLRIKVTSA